MANEKMDDVDVNRNWQYLLGKLEQISKEATGNTKSKLTKLEEEAANLILTDRQRDGIRARIKFEKECFDDPTKRPKINKVNGTDPKKN